MALTTSSSSSSSPRRSCAVVGSCMLSRWMLPMLLVVVGTIPLSFCWMTSSLPPSVASTSASTSSSLRLPMRPFQISRSSGSSRSTAARRPIMSMRGKPLQLSEKNVENDAASSSSSSSSSSSENNDEKKKDMSFEDASQALRDEEDTARNIRSGMMDEELERKFASKKSEYESMRERIRARTSDLGIERSKATAEAIAEAERRAQAGIRPGDSDDFQPDMSAFGDSAFMSSEPEDELSDDEMKEIDKVGQLSFLQQAMEEFRYTKWPSLGATLKLAGSMLILFAFTAAFILKTDEVVRNFYMDIGLVPRPDQVYDYSDLELPEDWLKDGTQVIKDVVQQGTEAVTDLVQE